MHSRDSRLCLLKKKLLYYLVAMIFLNLHLLGFDHFCFIVFQHNELVHDNKLNVDGQLSNHLIPPCLKPGYDNVVSVFRDHILQLHTTRSWDFLDAESGIGSPRLRSKASNDVIIGIIDTGNFTKSHTLNSIHQT